MKAKVHLISMPWADHTGPSIQTGCLKAFINQVFKSQVEVKTYSPFFTIRHLVTGQQWSPLLKEFEQFREYPYFLLYLKRFIKGVKRKIDHKSLARLISAINRWGCDQRSDGGTIGAKFLRHLEAATIQYIQQYIAPNLEKDAMNVVGFTTNFDQLYASVYCAKYLLNEYGTHKLMFLYGGYNASVPNDASLLRTLGLPGFLVVGEGEKKLEKIIQVILDTPKGSLQKLNDTVRKCAPGILDINGDDDFFEYNPEFYGTQLESIEDLPLWNYDDHFKEVRNTCANEAGYIELKQTLSLPIEGSRGCFNHCDFCGTGCVMEGFRKMSSERVIRNVRAMTRKYGIDQICFVDNVCDTWAEKYADAMIACGMRCPSFFELRAHHLERFWTKLALAGAQSIQIGVEALSPKLLKCMNKGTTVIQNLAAQKYLKELNITSCSNLMVHHPRSTLEDVLETQRVIMLIPHFDALALTNFGLTLRSPLYMSLSANEKGSLKPRSMVKIPKDLVKYAPGNNYQSPASMKLDREVKHAWDHFSVWYKAWVKHISMMDDVSLVVRRNGSDRLIITDTRSGETKETILEGLPAKVYNICHRASTREHIERELGSSRKEICGVLSKLVEKALVFKSAHQYLSLALRHRDELLQNYNTNTTLT